MNPPRWFRRTRPAHEPVRITPEDRLIAASFDHTPESWAELSSLARIDLREEFYSWMGLGR